MERAAKRDAQGTAISQKAPTGKRQTGRTADAPRPSDDEKAAFYADMVKSERYLPANTISNPVREAMLSRGLVKPERLRARGVW